MSLTKFVVNFFIFQLYARSCLAGNMIRIPTSEESSDLIEPMVTILKSCYEGQLTTIGIGGSASDFLISSLSSENLSVVLLDDTKRPTRVPKATRLKLHRLKIFVIMASSWKQFQYQVATIASSQWRNHMGQYYIIDRSPNRNACNMAPTFLSLAWWVQVLGAKFFCSDGTRRLIFSFNPYTSHAPMPWRFLGAFKAANNHPFSLFGRRYIDHREICDNIDFDVTKDIGGYPIRLGVRQSYSREGVLLSNITDHLSTIDWHIPLEILDLMNASLYLLPVPMNELVDGDIGDGIHPFDDVDTQYKTGLTIMTQYTGEKSQLSKIASVLDRPSNIGLWLVCLITAVFLKFFQHQTPMTAFLSTLRMFCNSCLTKLPLDVPSRFYLTGVFFFVVTIQGIFQGKLAALLSNRVPLPNIDSLEDLANSHHTISCQPIFENVFHYNGYFRDDRLEKRVTADPNCVKNVTRDASVACVGMSDLLCFAAAEYKLHMMKGHFYEHPHTYRVRLDWPLEQRFRRLLSRFIESNILYQVHKAGVEEALLTIEKTRLEGTDRPPKVFNLSDLGFGFVILGIGLTLATIIFIIEIIISRCVRSRIANSLRRFWPSVAFFREIAHTSITSLSNLVSKRR